MENTSNILVVVAHPDDEVLGCGASIAKWTLLGNTVHILIMAEGLTSRSLVRDRNAKSKELSLLSKLAHQAGAVLGATSVKLLGFPDNRMDSLDLLDIIKAIEKEVDCIKPNIVVTHHYGDLNVDHQITHNAVITACRPQPGQSVRRILTFEIPSSTEWQTKGVGFAFQPNWFEDVSNTIDLKIKALNIYKSEMRDWPHARSIESVKYLSRWRGSSIGCEAAEAMFLIREMK
jgi:N-acetylglucosamine malate deacetylase 1